MADAHSLLPPACAVAGRLIHWAAVQHGDRPSVVFRDRSFSHSDMDRRSNQVAHALRGCGLHRGRAGQVRGLHPALAAAHHAGHQAKQPWPAHHPGAELLLERGRPVARRQAQLSLRAAIHELETTQQTLWSPMVLNGSGFGVFANHSLVMANYLNRAQTDLADVRHQLVEAD